MAHLVLRAFARWERFARPAKPIEDRLRYVFSDSTRMLYQSAFWAIAATFGAWILFRAIVAPILRAGIAPKPIRGESVPREFVLEPGESVRLERSSTLRVEGSRIAGKLLLTDRRIVFIPRDWFAPARSIALGDVLQIGIVPACERLSSLVSGVPDHLAIVDRSLGLLTATLVDPAEFADRIHSHENRPPCLNVFTS